MLVFALIIFITALIMIAFSVYILLINDFSWKLIAEYQTAFGAIIVASFLIIKTTWVDAKSNNFIKKFEVVAIHDPWGTFLQIAPLFPKAPTLTNDDGVYPYVNFTSALNLIVHANPRLRNLDEKGNSKIYFDFVENYFLWLLSNEFAMDWNLNYENTSKSFFGGHYGSISYATPEKYRSSINLKKDVIGVGNNVFTDLDTSSHYQLAIPQGTKVIYTKDTEHECNSKLVFTNKRFKLTLKISMNDTFHLYGIRNYLSSDFYKYLFKTLNINITDEMKIRFRVINFELSFEQDALSRFSESSENDLLFAKNITNYLYDRYSWNKTSERIEKAINSK